MIRILVLIVVALIAVMRALPGRAADYPSRPIMLVVGYPPGGSADLSARIMAAALTQRLGQPVVVENKPGAAASIGSEFVARAAPDGYTLVYGTIDSINMVPAIKTNVRYKVPDDFTFIAMDNAFPFALAVSTKQPFQSVAELVAYAKANPGKLRYASSGVGGTEHMLLLMLQAAAGIQLTHVPYRGAGPAMTDLVAGFDDMLFETQSALAPFAQAGKIRLLGVATRDRQPFIPDVPTMTEAGYPSVEMSGWFGVMGPAHLPAAVTSRLEAAVHDATNDKQIQDQFAKVGIEVSYLNGEDFRRFAVENYHRLKDLADRNNLHVAD